MWCVEMDLDIESVRRDDPDILNINGNTLAMVCANKHRRIERWMQHDPEIRNKFNKRIIDMSDEL